MAEFDDEQLIVVSQVHSDVFAINGFEDLSHWSNNLPGSYLSTVMGFVSRFSPMMST